MDVPAVVASRLSGDPELLEILRSATDQEAPIDRSIYLALKVPVPVPSKAGSFRMEPAAAEAHLALMQRVMTEAEVALRNVTGLDIEQLSSLGNAVVRGSAKSLVEVIGLDCVENAMLGDRKNIFDIRDTPGRPIRI